MPGCRIAIGNPYLSNVRAAGDTSNRPNRKRILPASSAPAITGGRPLSISLNCLREVAGFSVFWFSALCILRQFQPATHRATAIRRTLVADYYPSKHRCVGTMIQFHTL